MNLKDKFTNIVKNVFDSPDQNEYNFVLSSPYENQSNSRTPEEIEKNEKIFEAENIFSSLSVNLEYVKVKSTKKTKKMAESKPQVETTFKATSTVSNPIENKKTEQ